MGDDPTPPVYEARTSRVLLLEESVAVVCARNPLATGAGMMESHVWECPCCGWIVSDVEYLAIRCDPDCAGCGVKKWSEFRYIESPIKKGEP